MNKYFTLFATSLLFLFFTSNSQAQSYCDAGSDSAADEWIQNIMIASFQNNSGNNNGYGDYTGQTISLNESNSYSISLTPGYAGNSFDEHWRIWIDYNDDGDFNDFNELVYDSGEGSASTVNGSFTTPSLSGTVNTRLRIAMKYVGIFSDGTEDFSAPTPCGNVEFGEVEDYSVTISSSGTGTSDSYCNTPGGNSTDEWIESISIGNFTNNSGNNNGYGDLTNNTIDVNEGETYTLNLTPGFSGNGFDEHWRIWIDYNNDNDFTDANELVYDSGQGFNSAINTSFTILNNAPIGETRLRIAMKYVGDFSDGTSDLNPPTPCDAFDFGEVEDYTINIGETSVLPLPNAQFNASTTAGMAPLSVQFFNQSTNAASFNWSFPGADPNNSTQENPSVVYNTPGTYAVFLTVVNATGTDTETKTNYITVSDNVAAPVSNFASNVVSGQAPLSVQFSDLSSNNPTSWNWTFEGGSPSNSSLQNPTVVFNQVGTYTVSLISGNSAGSDNEVKEAYITVLETQAAPIAQFTSNQTSGSAPLVVDFIDQSSNSPTNWSWTFEGGNPSSSTLQNPSIVYNEPGVYAVSLSCSNSIGVDTETKTTYITVSENIAAPAPNFTSNIVSGESPLTIQFTDLSSNNPTFWNWTFEGGNPSNSTQQHPVITYNMPGTYSVVLTAGNSGGNNTETKEAYVTVVESIMAPTANFISSQLTGVAPFEVSFFDQSTNNPTVWNWTFEGAVPTASNEQNPTVVYNNPGVYSVTMVCSNTAGADTETKTAYITVTEPEPLPIASFTASTFTGNPPLVVTFVDLSSNDPVSWNWSFPGASPATSNEQNPTVTYNNTGIFPVSLTATNESGEDTQMQLGYIEVLAVMAGIDKVGWEASLHLYPNPANEVLNIEVSFEEAGKASYTLYTILGQEIRSKEWSNISEINEQLFVSDLPNGSYFLKIQKDEDTFSKLIQIVH